jgi:predicted DNA-binding transcriptional regulator YafY
MIDRKRFRHFRTDRMHKAEYRPRVTPARVRRCSQDGGRRSILATPTDLRTVQRSDEASTSDPLLTLRLGSVSVR